MSNKYPFAGYTEDRKPGPGTNYTNLTVQYQNHPTEKQMKYLNDMIATCERVGIDLTNFVIRKRTRSGVRSSINALRTMLNKHGYDTWGNKLEEDKL